MENQKIEKLLQVSGEPCVSIIVPLHRLSPERIHDSRILHIAADQAKEQIKHKYPKPDRKIEVLINNIDDAILNIDFTHSKDGIGIYVSPEMSQIVEFTFPVKEKVRLGYHFDSRDLLYFINRIIDYRVLSISKKYIHFFAGKGEALHEIVNNDFPISYVEEYEYSRSSRGNSFGSTLKDYEKDKSVLQEVRLVGFLKTADQLLDKYLNGNIPLIVSGGKKEIADYLDISKHGKKIIGNIEGSYNFDGKSQLSEIAWTLVQSYLNDSNENSLSDLRELEGKGMAAISLEEVWKAAIEGKGLELIVEKDLQAHAYVEADNSELKLQKPLDNKKYTFIPDIIEKIIQIVREKGGKVVFVENDEMSEFNGIALRLRYNNSEHFANTDFEKNIQ